MQCAEVSTDYCQNINTKNSHPKAFSYPLDATNYPKKQHSKQESEPTLNTLTWKSDSFVGENTSNMR